MILLKSTSLTDSSAEQPGRKQVVIYEVGLWNVLVKDYV